MESPPDCLKRAVAQDHSHNYIRLLTTTPNLDERPAVASWPGAILSEPISLLKRSLTRLVGSKSEEASEGSGDSTAADRFLDSNTARKGAALIDSIYFIPANTPGTMQFDPNPPFAQGFVLPLRRSGKWWSSKIRRSVP